MASSAVELSSITQGQRERLLAGERESKQGDLNQYCIETGVLIIEDWKPRDLGSNITFASVCITWDCPVNIIGIPFSQLKNAEIGLD